MEGMKYYIPGFIFILAAVLVVAFPEILVAFIAALILFVGVGLLYIGHQFRKMENETWDDIGNQNRHFGNWWTVKDAIIRPRRW